MKHQESFVEKLAKEIIEKSASFESNAKRYLNSLFQKAITEGKKKGQFAFVKVKELPYEPMGYDAGYFVMTDHNGNTEAGGLGEEHDNYGSISSIKNVYKRFVDYLPYDDYKDDTTLKEFLSGMTFHVIKFRDMKDLKSKLDRYNMDPYPPNLF